MWLRWRPHCGEPSGAHRATPRVAPNVATVLGDPKKPWKVVVGDDFPKDQLPAK